MRSAMSQPNYCRLCGAHIKPGSRFCPHCGKGVTVVTRAPVGYSSPAAIPAPHQPSYPTPVPGVAQPSTNLRPASITGAAVLSAILGILTIIGGFILLAIGGIASSLPYLGEYAGGLVSVIGIVILGAGALRMLASVWLWNLQVKGGVLIIIIAIVSFLVNGVTLIVGNPLAIISIVLDFIALVLVAIGWHALR